MPDVKEVVLNFDVDRYLNPYVPKSQLAKLPKPIAHFLGHRTTGQRKVNNLLIWTWSFVGAFCGIALIEGVYRSSSVLQDWNPPIVIGSFGAAAILEYNTIESPLSQPRNLILGQGLSTVIGIGVTKLFHLLPPARFEDLRWLAGALAVGVSSFVMGVTKTVHPPAGATALLAATDPGLSEIGWYLLPLVLIACMLMLGTACVIDNVQRQFPQYWWTPMDVGSRLPRLHRKAISDPEDGRSEIVPEKEKSDSVSETSQSTAVPSLHQQIPPSVLSGSQAQSDDEYVHSESGIHITGDSIHVPEWMALDEWQKSVLGILKGQLRQGPANSQDD